MVHIHLYKNNYQLNTLSQNLSFYLPDCDLTCMKFLRHCVICDSIFLRGETSRCVMSLRRSSPAALLFKRGQISSEHMEKYWAAKYLNKFWFLIFTTFICWLLLLSHLYTNNSRQGTNIVNVITIKRTHNITVAVRSSLNQTETVAVQESKLAEDERNATCAGRYIFIQRIPRRFNEDLLGECKILSKWTDMCVFLTNNGLGPKLPNTDHLFADTGWYETNQFSLEVIFHNRMKHYDCLTENSSLASAIYVPFYPGLDISKYLWCCDTDTKDAAPKDLVKILTRKPEWRRMHGRDHFMVAGRICWDFRRPENSDWGSTFMLLPETKNMTTLVIETSPWNSTDVAIPYPTYFHPSSDQEVFHWQDRMRKVNRTYLFSFAGAPRPDQPGSVRGQLIEQCRSTKTCFLLECGIGESECHNPSSPMKMFQSSNFCLQPPGDSFTRRSTFDAILAGCIPVFFHPGSAYIQYVWHLPKNFNKYSVFIPMDRMKYRNMSVEEELMKIPKRRVSLMREEVIKLIPQVIYADPRSRLETLEDAFDITVKGILSKVQKMKKRMLK